MKRHEKPYNKADVVSNYDSAFSSYTNSINEFNKEFNTLINMIKKTITEIDEMVESKENHNE